VGLLIYSLGGGCEREKAKRKTKRELVRLANVQGLLTCRGIKLAGGASEKVGKRGPRKVTDVKRGTVPAGGGGGRGEGY